MTILDKASAPAPAAPSRDTDVAIGSPGRTTLTASLEDDATTATTASTATPRATFLGALGAKYPVEATVLRAWDALTDKPATDDATIVQAIQKLSPRAANRIRREAGERWSAPIVDAIVTRHKAKSWHDELAEVVEDIADAPAGDPRRRLDRIVQSRTFIGYKPEFVAARTEFSIGESFKLELADKAAYRMIGKWHRTNEALEKAVTFHTYLVVEGDVFPVGTEQGRRALLPDANSPATFAPCFTLTAAVTGSTRVELHGTVTTEDGLLARISHPLDLEVFDKKADPNGYFDARFQKHFASALKADCFASTTSPATLFTDAQRPLVLDYLERLIVPPRLFTSGANVATPVQRELIAAHMLTKGKIKMPDGSVDGARWAASCCGGWAQGVRAYAGVNDGDGYGSDSVEQSASPTGEKSYGSTKQEGDALSNLDIPEVARLLGPFNAKIKSASKKIGDAKKALAKKHPPPTEEQKAKLEAIIAEHQPVLDEAVAGKASVQPVANDAKHAAGSSRTSSGKQNMPAAHLWKTIRAGDWLFIDNGNTAGHSVIFASWADAAPTTGTDPDASPTDVEYRIANVYNQPRAGGVYQEYRIGFPYSTLLGVSGVYSITHVAKDAKPADTLETFLPFPREAAIIDNAKQLAKHGLAAATIRADLLVQVGGMASGIAGKHRPDQVGKLEGMFTERQAAIIEKILLGSDDVEGDIATLVALGQRLGVMGIVSGDPPSPNGKLASKKVGTWVSPLAKP